VPTTELTSNDSEGVTAQSMPNNGSLMPRSTCANKLALNPGPAYAVSASRPVRPVVASQPVDRGPFRQPIAASLQNGRPVPARQPQRNNPPSRLMRLPRVTPETSPVASRSVSARMSAPKQTMLTIYRRSRFGNNRHAKHVSRANHRLQVAPLQQTRSPSQRASAAALNRATAGRRMQSKRPQPGWRQNSTAFGSGALA
jgi:hypothetical protein